jgi:CDP-diglyceride synthetase
MRKLWTRLFALVIIAACAGLIYYEWHRASEQGRYSIKVVTFAPLGIVGGLFMILFPALAGKPETRREKLIVLLVFAVGVLAGLVNWYLIDPGFFH